MVYEFPRLFRDSSLCIRKMQFRRDVVSTCDTSPVYFMGLFYEVPRKKSNKDRIQLLLFKLIKFLFRSFSSSRPFDPNSSVLIRMMTTLIGFNNLSLCIYGEGKKNTF